MLFQVLGLFWWDAAEKIEGLGAHTFLSPNEDAGMSGWTVNPNYTTPKKIGLQPYPPQEVGQEP